MNKKVTFAMVQYPSQDSVASIGSSLSINNNNTDGSTNAGILVISPGRDEVLLQDHDHVTGEIQGETEHGQPRVVLGDRDQGGHHVRDLLNLARDKFIKLLEETDK